MPESGGGKYGGRIKRRDMLKVFSVVPAALVPAGALAAGEMKTSQGDGGLQKVVRIEASNEIASLPVVADVLPDLRKGLSDHGYHLTQRTDIAAAPIRLVLTGNPEHARESVKVAENFVWEPLHGSGGSLIAPDPLSLEAGILWLTDRVACEGKIPTKAHKAERAFTQWLAYLSTDTQGNDQRATGTGLDDFRRNALVAARMGATDVVVRDTNRIMIWDSASRPQAEQYRKLIKGVTGVAHDLGLGLFLYGDELIYQPAWLKEQGARLSTSDPKLWQALASKYRQVLTALPDIDGIMTRTGEIIPWPGVEPFDLIHNRGDHSERGIVDNYREFLKTVYGVVVGEFGKTYAHRTWSTSNYEQSSVPQVYNEIFSVQPPAANFFSIIKLTLCDQWEWQPLNPTFGVTPQATLATIETGRCTSPILDYAVPFYQSGMQWARDQGSVGLLAGVSPGQLKQDVSDSTIDESVAYCLWRLAWTPNADSHLILKDWAKRRLGSAAAEQVADILPSLGKIVRDCWYLQPFVDLQWNPQVLFGGTHFVVKGNPIFDRGAGQDRFLRWAYLTCKPWLRETMSQVSDGVWRYDQVLSRMHQITPVLKDPKVGKAWEERIWRVREAFNTYRAYVQTFLICYAYRDTPTKALRNEFAYRLADLKKTLSAYVREPGHFRVRAIRIFIDIADRALANPEALNRYLAEAPTPEEIDAKLKANEARDRALAKRCPSATTYFSWEGSVDGAEILVIRGKNLIDEHQTGNQAHNIHYQIHRPIPERPLTYFLVRHAGRGWTTILQTPSAENNWTAKIYVSDPQPSEDAYRFDLKGTESCDGPMQ